MIDAALVRQLIAAQFPGWADLPVRQVLPVGWDNRTFRLGEALLVRLPRAERYAAQVEKEQRWLPVLAAHLPVAVPVPVAMGRASDAFPWPWSVYGWIAGEAAGAAWIGDMWAFAQGVAAFLRALQRVETAGGPAPGAHNFHRGRRLAVYDGEVRAALTALVGQLDARAVLAVWDGAMAAEWVGAGVWVHGDVAAGNLLVRDGALAAVIDFGGLAVGDPACDLVIAWTLFEGAARGAFRDGVALDAGTWARARGWALWKALMTVTGEGKRAEEVEMAWRVIGAVLREA